MKRSTLLSLSGAVALVVALGFIFRNAHQTPTKPEHVSTPGVDAEGYPLPSPSPPPLTPRPYPMPPKQKATAWGPCADATLRSDGANRYLEDRALRLVLESQVQDDPLFGRSQLTMEGAECAARRWRLQGL